MTGQRECFFDHFVVDIDGSPRQIFARLTHTSSIPSQACEAVALNVLFNRLWSMICLFQRSVFDAVCQNFFSVCQAPIASHFLRRSPWTSGVTVRRHLIDTATFH
ncbi:hypothetical protein RISK_003990 [Rhodopirellula islandica]|uniref:Uncharacterized protein n=1 Tax=Rhodopirellula islandica TaxID=595434 RepID=A0A0J1BBY2_RHOIS|nr:hypothetical protein RISK_003990 [Rhodopirellula islandica]